MACSSQLTVLLSSDEDEAVGEASTREVSAFCCGVPNLFSDTQCAHLRRLLFQGFDHNPSNTPEKMHNNLSASSDGGETVKDGILIQELSRDKIHLVLLGTPRPLPRPRFVAKSRKLFDPSYKQKVSFRSRLERALNAYGAHGSPLFDRKIPLSVHVVFEMPRPPSHFRKDGNFRSNVAATCSTRPDIDNLCKYVLDCFNGIVYVDDSQVVSLCADKAYCETPGCGRTDVVVSRKL